MMQKQNAYRQRITSSCNLAVPKPNTGKRAIGVNQDCAVCESKGLGDGKASIVLFHLLWVVIDSQKTETNTNAPQIPAERLKKNYHSFIVLLYFT